MKDMETLQPAGMNPTRKFHIENIRFLGHQDAFER